VTSSRPYLIRALYEWIIDNSCTPYLLVDATVKQAQVPAEYVENGKIVLNISPSAVRRLSLANDQVRFSARFGGRAHEIAIPVQAVLAVYARENGQGMMFNEDGGINPPPKPPPSATGAKKPTLKVVK